MIQAPRNATLAEALYRDIDKNDYLNEIYGNLLYNYSIKLFGSDRKPREVVIKDALRFSDLLSKSSYPPTADRDRLWGQEIAILLRLLYPEDESVRYYLGSSLSAVGNFRGLRSKAVGAFVSADLLDQITDRTLLLILDGVTDPRNFGACLRAADAAGVQAVIVPRDRSARMTPAAAKAAAGAAETVPVVSVTNLASAIMELRDNGVFVAGTAGETDTTIYDVAQARAFAWVLGAEGEGLRQLTRRRCDVLAAIPMVGSVESLNVSVASGICLFESLRQRIAAGLVQPGSPDERL